MRTALPVQVSYDSDHFAYNNTVSTSLSISFKPSAATSSIRSSQSVLAFRDLNRSINTTVTMWFHVSEPNTYLVVTGIGIKDVIIAKKRFVKPLQKVTKISITPFDFSMSLQAMTSEKLQFNLPAVFTIGPKNNPADLKKYAELLTGDSDGHVRLQKGVVATGGNHVQDIVKGVIEGETRSIVSNMTMEELFNNRKLFKDQVVKNVQAELEVFGLYIYNANVKELQDMGECLSC